ncbi:hypothetical protein CVT26_015024 [Gymnopilus dilepis]|uniref:DNA 3'-5' helicase n=1 Tax=Gymnopilus dilepis TaxID=231916 RepID=A0A409YNQ1_9AGAR|nr:hypothetical protein CVT26_015024 [Gymnopilus dilepis]
MVPQPRWQDPHGLATINIIVKNLIPGWTNGLHPVQLELVSAILDQDDVLCCTATGDGKSAAFSIPTLVLQEYNRTPGTYIAGLPSRTRPIGVVITPTKGLAQNIVHELSKLSVSAFSYCKETLTEARKTGVRLATEIKECVKWQVICVDPEHLHDKEWREITEGPVFRANILFTCVDEVHLINEWGLSFRPSFSVIGAFLRGRFPSSMSVVGLSATLEPGAPTVSVCRSLGFFEGRFILIRRSNERPNTQFSIQYLPRGLSGDKFDFLLPYLADLRKTIIHCRTIDQVSRVHAYLWRLQPDGSDKLRRVRIYHSVCPADYNKETIQLLETDPQLQIVVSTVAFSNGLNAKTLLDSLSLGFGSTFNETWQEKGRVGRDPETIGRGVIFAPRRIIKEATSYLASVTSLSAPLHQRNDRSKKKAKLSTPAVFDKSKALVIVEKSCHIACINVCYENPSADPSRPNLPTLDCIAAGRRIPCLLCQQRQGSSSIDFPPSPMPPDLPSLPILTAPHTRRKASASKKDKLTKKERALAEEHLVKFGDSLWSTERRLDGNQYRPRSSYFPPRILSVILDALLIIHFPADLDSLLAGSWIYLSTHGRSLFDAIIDIQSSINTQRMTSKELALMKRRDRQPNSETIRNTSEISASSGDEPAREPDDGQPYSGRKRPALEDVTNTTKRQRMPRTAQPSVAQVTESYGPQYRTRRIAHLENEVHVTETRNSRMTSLRPRIP